MSNSIINRKNGLLKEKLFNRTEAGPSTGAISSSVTTSNRPEAKSSTGAISSSVARGEDDIKIIDHNFYRLFVHKSRITYDESKSKYADNDFEISELKAFISDH